MKQKEKNKKEKENTTHKKKQSFITIAHPLVAFTSALIAISSWHASR